MIKLTHKLIHLILAISSGVIGFVYLVTCSILIIEIVRNVNCDVENLFEDTSTLTSIDPPGLCKKEMIAAISMGVIVSVVQSVWCLGVLIMHRLGPPDGIWQYLHIGYALLTLISLSLAIHHLNSFYWKDLIFKIVAGVNVIFCLVSPPTVRYVIK